MAKQKGKDGYKEFRRCCSCQRLYPIEGRFFPRNRASSYGYSYTCHECNRVNNRQYAVENPDKIRANRRAFNKRHPEQVAQTWADYIMFGVVRKQESLQYAKHDRDYQDKQWAQRMYMNGRLS